MLHNMLYTLCVTKKFLSVSQFLKDSQIYFEFHASHCLVKDSILHRVLFCGLESGGLNQLDLSYFPTIHRDTAQTAVISLDVSLSVTDQIMVSCNKTYKSAYEIPHMNLNDNAIVDFDDIHSSNFMNDSEFTCFLSSLKSNDTSEMWHMHVGHPYTNQLVNFLCLRNLPTKYVSTECATCAAGK